MLVSVVKSMSESDSSITFIQQHETTPIYEDDSTTTTAATEETTTMANQLSDNAYFLFVNKYS